jgi:hypothetical protein
MSQVEWRSVRPKRRESWNASEQSIRASLTLRISIGLAPKRLISARVRRKAGVPTHGKAG